ncbi:MAG TPA: MBL fold metallo-hydrolase RNA specificity domain-containing protein, partial [Myxococcota bacterium]|nr:MBL fold metallo-hydrolase RNA specificity domain-containing protein [Myxococcota bacterium]
IERSYTLGDGMRVRDVWLGRGIFRLLGLDWQSPEHRELVIDAVREMLLDGYEAKLPRTGALAHWRRIWTPGTSKAEERRVPRGPAVVLATGGMCEGGPVQFYLRSLLADPTTTVLFPGYCSASTIGGKLLEMRNLDETQRKRLGGALELDGFSVNQADIRAVIQKIDGYSAHADQAGLLDWMWSGKPGERRAPIARTIFISHGTPEPRRKLESAIQEKARATGDEVTVELPPRGQWYDLDHGRWLDEGLTREQIMLNELMRLKAENELLKRESSMKAG